MTLEGTREMEESKIEGDQHTKIITSKLDESRKLVQVYDSSLDYKGRLPLRASTGSWKAAFFIIAIEFSERLSYFGMSANMITYMTKVMHQDLETAVNSVNIWTGATTVMPLFGGFLGDAYVGRFSMVLYSSILYALGLGIFTATQYIPSLKPCETSHKSCEHVNKLHKLFFFIAAYVVSLATGGYKPCLESFGADQFDENDSKERKQKMSFFNWWNITVCGGLFLGVTLIVYVEDYVDWGIAFLILTITMALTVLIFLIGRRFYRYRIPQGSPLTPLFQVLVAAAIKRHLPHPLDPASLYEVPKTERFRGQLLGHTNRLRFLDKAAIIEDHESVTSTEINPWRLKTVTQVEELKLILGTTPVWLTSLVFGIGLSSGSTLFIKQGSTMNRRIFNQFEIPPASMYALTGLALIITVAIYDKILLPYLRRVTGTERGINILQRIGIGMVFLIIAMIVSALVERKRLMSVKQGEMINVSWLVPQFVIMGIGDGFSLVGMQEYFYDQVPDSMRSLGMAFYLSVIGVGSFLCSLLIVIVDHVTSNHGGKRWIGKNLNDSHLDYFYWLLASISVLNLCVFILLTRNYNYKNVLTSEAIDDSYDGHKGVGFAP